MNVLSAIEKRREITRFKPDSIADEVINTIIRSIYLSPSGNNLPSREFILITCRDTLRMVLEHENDWAHGRYELVVDS